MNLLSSIPLVSTLGQAIARKKEMNNSKYEIPFEKRLPSFSTITIWERPENLQFAINQLDARGKKYSIEKRKSLIRVWSESNVGVWL